MFVVVSAGAFASCTIVGKVDSTAPAPVYEWAPRSWVAVAARAGFLGGWCTTAVVFGVFLHRCLDCLRNVVSEVTSQLFDAIWCEDRSRRGSRTGHSAGGDLYVRRWGRLER